MIAEVAVFMLGMRSVMCVTTVIPVSSESWLTVISAVRQWITFGKTGCQY